jgi:hypothetical protein
MRVGTVVAALVFAGTLTLCHRSAADDQGAGDLEALKQQVRMLQSQLDEVRAQHAAEIKALSDRVAAASSQ